MKKIVTIILAIVLCAGVVGGGIAGILKLSGSGKLDKKNISKFSYSVGGLDGNGKYKSTNASVYTKDAFECQGLECSLEFDNNVSYQVYFYDQNNDFVHTTGKLTGAFVKDSVPFFAKYARIVITPNDDDVVTKTEIFKYSKQLKVSVNREQGYKNYTENLISKINSGYFYNQNDGVKTAVTESYTSSLTSCTDLINILPYKEAVFFRCPPNSDYAAGVEIFSFDKDGAFLKKNLISTVSGTPFTTSTGVVYYNIDKKVLAENAAFIALNVLPSGEYKLFAR